MKLNSQTLRKPAPGVVSAQAARPPVSPSTGGLVFPSDGPKQWGATWDEVRELVHATGLRDLVPIMCNPARQDEPAAGPLEFFFDREHGRVRGQRLVWARDPDLGVGLHTNYVRAIRVTPPKVREPFDDYPHTAEQAIEGMFGRAWVTRLHYPDGRTAYLCDQGTGAEVVPVTSETFEAFDGSTIEIMGDGCFLELAGTAPGGGRYRRDRIYFDQDWNEIVEPGWRCIADSPLWGRCGHKWPAGVRAELQWGKEQVQ